MQIQVNTDNHISGGDERAAWVKEAIEAALGRFGERLTRVEAYLSDIDSHKGGPADIRCVLEARPAGLKPLAASHRADVLELAVEGAAEKLRRGLESILGRQQDRLLRPEGKGTPEPGGQ